MNEYALTVVIPVYNNLHELHLTLSSLVNQTLNSGSYEVIIADDGSSVDVQGVMKEYSQLNIQYHFQEDLGFRPGQARNMGIKHARGKVIVFIDCGVILESTALSSHMEVHAGGDGNEILLGYVYGMNINFANGEMQEIIVKNTIKQAIRIMHERGMDDGRESLYQDLGDNVSEWPAPWVTLWSLHFSVSRRFLSDHNLFFDDFYKTWGCEDNDFGVALWHSGGKYVLGRHVKSIHYPAVVKSYDLLKNPDFRAAYDKNKQYLIDKYPNDMTVSMLNHVGMFKLNRAILEGKMVSVNQ